MRPPTPYNPAALPDASVNAWNDDDTDAGGEVPFKALTRDEARELAAKDLHAVNPWRVVAVQAAVGLGMALLLGAIFQRMDVFWSALYGAGVVVLPAALMARGMTSAFTSMSPLTSAVGVMGWEMVKIVVSILLLGLAPKIVQPLVWPALLGALVVCIKVYWVALAWRRRG
jgi:ATP synthase protein I